MRNQDKPGEGKCTVSMLVDFYTGAYFKVLRMVTRQDLWGVSSLFSWRQQEFFHSPKHVRFVVKSWCGCTACWCVTGWPLQAVIDAGAVWTCCSWCSVEAGLPPVWGGRGGQAGVGLKECCSWIISGLRVILYLPHEDLWQTKDFDVDVWFFTVVHAAVCCRPTVKASQ